MKKLILTSIILFATFAINAQAKVWSGGNMVIGSTSSSSLGAKLQIAGNSVFTASVASTTSSAYIRGLNAYSTATTPDYTWYGNDQAGMFHPASNELAFSTGGTDRVHLDQYALSLSNLGTGLVINAINGGWPTFRTNFPTGTYTASAASSYCNYVTYHGSDNFYIQGTGDVTGKSFTSTSDSLVKKEINPILDASKKINKLRGVTFKYNFSDAGLNDNNEVAMGLIAQEVERVVPEVVRKSKDGIKGICYQNLIGLLIEGFKEQSKKLDSLQQRLDACCPPSPKTGQRTINNEGGQKAGNSSTPFVGDLQLAKLEQNSPNPFNQTSTIKCYVPESAKKTFLLIFDMNGTLKKTMSIATTGDISLTIHASQFIAGMYYYTLIIDGSEIDTKKMILTEQ